MTPEEKLKVFERFLEVTEDSILIVDREGRIVDVNPAYYRTMLISRVKPRSEVIGLPVSEVFTNSVLPGLMAKNEPAQMNLDLFPSGPEFNLEFTDKEIAIRTCANVLDDSGNVIGAFACVRTHRQIMDLCDAVVDVKRELNFYKSQLYKLTNEIYSYDDIIGGSEAILKTKTEMIRAAATDFSVVITGETGTGKELFASAVHRNSERREYPFIRVNCSAIPQELFESELFGYEEGAFTGAKKGGKPGKFELANRGTLFLDEIGDLPLSMQAKLLRALQEQEIDRIGAAAPTKVDVRIIAATNKDLMKCVREKTFRADLYYRLNVIAIRIPPLRERREDVSKIAESFLQELNEKYNTRAYFSADALLEMQEYDWPGNVRELKNAVERMYAFREESTIRRMFRPEDIGESGDEGMTEPSLVTLPEQIERFERSVIEDRLRKNHYNFHKTAQQLGMNRGTLYNKVKKYRIPIREDAQGSEPAGAF